jgi:outer membrane protein assembly factor BamB
MKRLVFVFAMLLVALGVGADIQGLAGGLVVCVGVDAAEQVANDWKTESYVFQCLEEDATQISNLREKAQAAGVHGRVTVKRWGGGALPYVDGLVNLLVLGDEVVVDNKEIARVLAPGGAVLSGGKRSVKPWPDDVDDWTHFLHSAGNNAVADDQQVGPPRTLRWDCGPKYSRSHELDVSVAAAVIEGGRLFTITDKGPAGTIGKKTPDKWMLEARDAFNGILLWERPVPNWSWRVWKPELLQLDEWNLIAQRRLIPATLPRRLVAVDGKVYVTLGVGAPVSVLDAVTGKEIREIKETDGVDEILLSDGVLLMTKRPHQRETALTTEMTIKRQASKSPMPVSEDGLVMAADAASGKLLWKAPVQTVIPYTLAAERGLAFFHTGSELVALDLKSGRKLWRIENSNTDANRWDSRHILVAHKDVVLLSVPKKLCEAFDAATGKLLWSGKGGRGSAFNTTPMDLFVIDDMMWFTDGKQYEGKDIYTGEVKKTIDLPTYFLSPGHHLRCYRAKATTRYILDNKRGIEFMDMQETNHQKNDWVRGACRYGVIPANGLIYSTPTPCSCYQTVLLQGYNALSAALPPKPEKTVLEKGAAFGQGAWIGKQGTETDWPTFRRNVAREGSVSSGAGPALKRSWSKKLGGKLTQPVVVGDRLYVVSRESSTLFALDAKTGRVVWSRATPAEVDSPPAYWQGQLLFGCKDGWVYNLRAADGELAWRFRAAPTERQIVSYGRLESSWPVHGNVLVVDGTAYVAAGRNTYLDGGIYLYGLDAGTGAVRHRQHLANPMMDNEKPYTPHSLEGAMPDIMVFDGKTISMQSKTFDLDLNPVEKPASSHVYTSGGFLDDQAWHRNIWLYTTGWTLENKNASTYPNAGQLLVHEGGRSYGVKYFTEQTGQSMVFYPEGEGYNLFCDRDHESWDSLLSDYLNPKASGAKKEKTTTRQKRKTNPESETSIWSTWIPVRVRAMVKTGDVLFISGAPDEVPSADPLAPFEGRGRGILQAVSPSTGGKIMEYTLDAPPIFDGLISANGKVYVSLENGAVECW